MSCATENLPFGLNPPLGSKPAPDAAPATTFKPDYSHSQQRTGERSLSEMPSAACESIVHFFLLSEEIEGGRDHQHEEIKENGNDMATS